MWKSLAFALASACCVFAAASSAHAKDIVVHAGRLLDGTMKPARSNVSIVIKDDRIAVIEEGFVRPAGAEVIDLSRQTVMPGFIEAHDHLDLTNDRDDAKPRPMTASEANVTVIRNAYAEVSTGFTSTRDCGSHLVDFRVVKYAIGKGG